jgi:hypothetical protein
MTPRQQDLLFRLAPFIGLLVSGVIAWTTLKRDVSESVRIPRFEKDSISNQHDHRDYERQLLELKANQKSLDAICRAVRCR